MDWWRYQYLFKQQTLVVCWWRLPLLPRSRLIVRNKCKQSKTVVLISPDGTSWLVSPVQRPGQFQAIIADCSAQVQEVVSACWCSQGNDTGHRAILGVTSCQFALPGNIPSGLCLWFELTLSSWLWSRRTHHETYRSDRFTYPNCLFTSIAFGKYLKFP